MSNIFAIYKPKGPTSRHILNELQKITGERHIGHAGTLDPLASGVLVVGVGRESTRKLTEVVKKEKEYVAKIKLGETSATDDVEGEKTPYTSGISTPSREFVQKNLQQFIGNIFQIPPVYSAVKINGQEAYKRVRRGEKVQMESREIEIKEIEILEYEYPLLTLRVVTGPGVYIRSLARDIGKALGVGAYLAELERTRVGDFKKEDALPIEKIAEILIN